MAGGAALLTGGASLTMTGAMKGAGFGAKMTGLEKVKDAFGNLKDAAKAKAIGAAETLGIMLPGSAGDMRRTDLQKRYAVDDETKKKMDNLNPEENLKYATGQAFTLGVPKTAAQTRQRIYAIQQAIANGSINSLDPNKKKEAIEYLIASGFSASEATKGQPDLADLDKGGLSKLKARNKQGAGESPEDYEKRILAMLTREKYDQMDKSKYKDMNNEDLIKLAEEESAEGARALEEAIQRGIISKVKGANPALIGALLNKAKVDYGSGSMNSAKKYDPRYMRHDEKAVEEELAKTGLTRSTATAAQITAAEEKLVSEAYKKLEVSDIRKMEADSIDEHFIENTTAQKIGKAGEDLSDDRIQKLGDQLPYIDAEIISTAGAIPGSSDEKRHRALLAKKKAIETLVGITPGGAGPGPTPEVRRPPGRGPWFP